MIVLDLCQKFCPEKIPVKTTDRINDGSDGEVFSIENDLNKVIKFSIIYDRFYKSPENVYQKSIVPILDYVMLSQPNGYVRVYEHGYLGEYSRQAPYWKQGIQTFAIHYYIMERLFPLTDDEQKVFHSLLSHEDLGIENIF